MKSILMLAITWVALFFGGHALGANMNGTDYDPYYYCAATSDACSEGWFAYVGSFTGECCCDLNHD